MQGFIGLVEPFFLMQTVTMEFIVHAVRALFLEPEPSPASRCVASQAARRPSHYVARAGGHHERPGCSAAWHRGSKLVTDPTSPPIGLPLPLLDSHGTECVPGHPVDSWNFSSDCLRESHPLRPIPRAL